MARTVEEAKQLRAAGWDISVLVAPDRASVVLVGCLPAAARFELGRAS